MCQNENVQTWNYVGTTFILSWFSHCFKIKRNLTNLTWMWSRFDCRLLFRSFYLFWMKPKLFHKKSSFWSFIVKKIGSLFFNKWIKFTIYLYYIIYVSLRRMIEYLCCHFPIVCTFGYLKRQQYKMPLRNRNMSSQKHFLCCRIEWMKKKTSWGKSLSIGEVRWNCGNQAKN